MTEKIKFKKHSDNAVVPFRTTDNAGGWDVVATNIVKVRDDLYICELGFSLEIPNGTKLTIVPRSSQTKLRWVMLNSPGLGDSDFRGMYQIRFTGIPSGVEIVAGKAELTYDEFPFKVGDRIGQVYLETVIPINFEITDDLSDTNRLNDGFGTSGK